jgi:hypothetical protein
MCGDIEQPSITICHILPRKTGLKPVSAKSRVIYIDEWATGKGESA